MTLVDVKGDPHHPSCSADYPEKVPGEAPQALQRIELEDPTQWVEVCVDCGATINAHFDDEEPEQPWTTETSH